jgi:pimeloyl-ACP methyl ester carboxylesterase
MSKERIESVIRIILCAMVAGAAAPGSEQASAVRARHHAGQTFITWQEVDQAARADAMSMEALRAGIRAVEQDGQRRYRIYRAPQPIASLDGLRPIAEVRPLTCWNADYYGSDPKPDAPALRYVIAAGAAPLPAGTGVYVHNPRQPGRAWYAVTCISAGVENTALGPSNRLEDPVEESVAAGEPVLQRVVKPKDFQYIGHPTLHYYVRWESPPNSNVEGRPFDYLVAVPPHPAKPAPVGIHLHCWGGSLDGGYGWWYNAEKGAILIASNQIPYDWWTGYHERWSIGPRDETSWRSGVVRPYSQRRMLSFLAWVATKWDVDRGRTFVAGSSMGGSGAPMFAIRYPDEIAWAISWVGVHVPALSPQFKGSYAQVYGEHEWGIAFEDGTPVWDYFDDVQYLRKHPTAEIGFITFSNGKNDGGIGWPQAVAFLTALQETKRPHLFVWGQGGHGQRALMPVSLEERVLPIDVQTRQSLPAFTRCSFDGNPGNGEPADGDPAGQVNAYLFWETDDIVDEPDRWEITVGLIDKAPKDDCSVDLTPRRLQRFAAKAAPGSVFSWSNDVTPGNRRVQSGSAKADGWGLVTIEGLRLTKGKHRISLAR